MVQIHLGHVKEEHGDNLMLLKYQCPALTNEAAEPREFGNVSSPSTNLTPSVSPNDPDTTKMPTHRNNLCSRLTDIDFVNCKLWEMAPLLTDE